MESTKLAEIFQTLSNLRRVEMLKLLLLSDSGMSSRYISDNLDIPPGPTSQGLRALLAVGLLTDQKSGRFVYYFPNRIVTAQLAEFLLDSPKDIESPLEIPQ